MSDNSSTTTALARPSSGLSSRALGCAVVLVLWAGIVFKHLENRSLDLSAATKNLQNYSFLIEENTIHSIDGLDITLRYLRNTITSATAPIDYQALVRNADVFSGILVQVAVIDEHGQLLASSSRPQPGPSIDLSDREHFKVHQNSARDFLFISKPVVGRASGKQSVQLTRRIAKPDGSFGGVVVASLDPQHFTRIFEQVDLGVGASAALIGHDGVVRATAGQSAPFQLGNTVESERLKFDRAGNDPAVFWAPSFATSSTDLVVARKIAGQPLYVTARIPNRTVYGSSTYNLLILSIAGLLLSILAGLAARWGWQHDRENERKARQLHASHLELHATNAKLSEVNERLQLSEADARRQHCLFEGIFSSAADGLVVTDSARHIVDANAALLATFGYAIDELRGQPTKLLYKHEGEWHAVGERLKQGAPITKVVEAVDKSGKEFPCKLTLSELRDSSANLIGHVGVVRDLTDERRQEAALQQKQRLESLGRLTGGIAHDFNNLLTVISANVQLAAMTDIDDKRRHFLGAAEKAVKMGGTLTRHLTTFARQRTLKRTSVDLSELVSQMKPMIKILIGESIQLSTSLVEAAPVLVDVGEMENALFNLASNARDAIGASGGSLSLVTSEESVDRDAATIMGVEPGSFIRLDAIDTGVGMTPEVAAHAVDPFFTTKAVGKGAGLGLTTVDGFIRQSGGYISIDSKIAGGTKVSIYLPRSVDSTQTSTVLKGPSAVVTTTQKVILVVEDNPGIRSVVREQLEHLGYRTLEASCGESALNLLRSEEAVDLIFSDVVMPGAISGPELCRRAAKSWPHIRCLLTSGFSRSADFDGLAVGPILQKPYTMSELSRAIESALDTNVDNAPRALDA